MTGGPDPPLPPSRPPYQSWPGRPYRRRGLAPPPSRHPWISRRRRSPPPPPTFRPRHIRGTPPYKHYRSAPQPLPPNASSQPHLPIPYHSHGPPSNSLPRNNHARLRSPPRSPSRRPDSSHRPDQLPYRSDQPPPHRPDQPDHPPFRPPDFSHRQQPLKITRTDPPPYRGDHPPNRIFGDHSLYRGEPGPLYRTDPVPRDDLDLRQERPDISMRGEASSPYSSWSRPSGKIQKKKRRPLMHALPLRGPPPGLSHPNLDSPRLSRYDSSAGRIDAQSRTEPSSSPIPPTGPSPSIRPPPVSGDLRSELVQSRVSNPPPQQRIPSALAKRDELRNDVISPRPVPGGRMSSMRSRPERGRMYPRDSDPDGMQGRRPLVSIPGRAVTDMDLSRAPPIPSDDLVRRTSSNDVRHLLKSRVSPPAPVGDAKLLSRPPSAKSSSQGSRSDRGPAPSDRLATSSDQMMGPAQLGSSQRHLPRSSAPMGESLIHEVQRVPLKKFMALANSLRNPTQSLPTTSPTSRTEKSPRSTAYPTFAKEVLTSQAPSQPSKSVGEQPSPLPPAKTAIMNASRQNKDSPRLESGNVRPSQEPIVAAASQLPSASVCTEVRSHVEANASLPKRASSDVSMDNESVKRGVPAIKATHLPITSVPSAPTTVDKCSASDDHRKNVANPVTTTSADFGRDPGLTHRTPLRRESDNSERVLGEHSSNAKSKPNVSKKAEVMTSSSMPTHSSGKYGSTAVLPKPPRLTRLPIPLSKPIAEGENSRREPALQSETLTEKQSTAPGQPRNIKDSVREAASGTRISDKTTSGPTNVLSRSPAPSKEVSTQNDPDTRRSSSGASRHIERISALSEGPSEKSLPSPRNREQLLSYSPKTDILNNPISPGRGADFRSSSKSSRVDTSQSLQKPFKGNQTLAFRNGEGLRSVDKGSKPGLVPSEAGKSLDERAKVSARAPEMLTLKQTESDSKTVGHSLERQPSQSPKNEMSSDKPFSSNEPEEDERVFSMQRKRRMESSNAGNSSSPSSPNKRVRKAPSVEVNAFERSKCPTSDLDKNKEKTGPQGTQFPVKEPVLRDQTVSEAPKIALSTMKNCNPNEQMVSETPGTPAISSSRVIPVNRKTEQKPIQDKPVALHGSPGAKSSSEVTENAYFVPKVPIAGQESAKPASMDTKPSKPPLGKFAFSNTMEICTPETPSSVRCGVKVDTRGSSTPSPSKSVGKLQAVQGDESIAKSLKRSPVMKRPRVRSPTPCNGQSSQGIVFSTGNSEAPTRRPSSYPKTSEEASDESVLSEIREVEEKMRLCQERMALLKDTEKTPNCDLKKRKAVEVPPQNCPSPSSVAACFASMDAASALAVVRRCDLAMQGKFRLLLTRNQCISASSSGAFRNLCSDPTRSLAPTTSPIKPSAISEETALKMRTAISRMKKRQVNHERFLAKEYVAHRTLWMRRLKIARDKRSKEKREISRDRDRYLLLSTKGQTALLTSRTSSGRTSTKIIPSVSGNGINNCTAELDARLAEIEAEGGTPGLKDKWSKTLACIPNQNPNHQAGASSSVLVENPLLDYHASRSVNPWLFHEKVIFLEKFIVHSKNFLRIATFLQHKSTRECAQFYFANKLVLGIKQLAKEASTLKRKGLLRSQIVAVARKRQSCEMGVVAVVRNGDVQYLPAVEAVKIYVGDKECQLLDMPKDMNHAKVAKVAAEEKKGSSAPPVKLSEKFMSSCDVLELNGIDHEKFVTAYTAHGTDWHSISKLLNLKNKHSSHVREFYRKNREKIEADVAMRLEASRPTVLGGRKKVPRSKERIGRSPQLGRSSSIVGGVFGKETSERNDEADAEPEPMELDGGVGAAAANERARRVDLDGSRMDGSNDGWRKNASVERPNSSPIRAEGEVKKVKTTTTWTAEEGRVFRELFKVHGRDWKKIAEVMAPKTATQIKGYWRTIAHEVGEGAPKKGNRTPSDSANIGVMTMQQTCSPKDSERGGDCDLMVKEKRTKADESKVGTRELKNEWKEGRGEVKESSKLESKIASVEGHVGGEVRKSVGGEVRGLTMMRSSPLPLLRSVPLPLPVPMPVPVPVPVTVPVAAPMPMGVSVSVSIGGNGGGKKVKIEEEEEEEEEAWRSSGSIAMMELLDKRLRNATEGQGQSRLPKEQGR